MGSTVEAHAAKRIALVRIHTAGRHAEEFRRELADRWNNDFGEDRLGLSLPRPRPRAVTDRERLAFASADLLHALQLSPIEKERLRPETNRTLCGIRARRYAV